MASSLTLLALQSLASGSCLIFILCLTFYAFGAFLRTQSGTSFLFHRWYLYFFLLWPFSHDEGSLLSLSSPLLKIEVLGSTYSEVTIRKGPPRPTPYFQASLQASRLLFTFWTLFFSPLVMPGSVRASYSKMGHVILNFSFPLPWRCWIS